MIHGMAHGTLFRDPETRTAKNGNQYVVAVLKVEDGDATVFVRATIFSETARDELADLRAGDAVCVVGRLEASAYERQGETRIGYSIVADRAIGLTKTKRQKSKPSNASPIRGTRPIDQAAVARLAASSGQASRAAPTKQIGDGPAPWERERAPINDEIPF